MIIDAHAHLGYDTVFDEEATEKELLEYYNKYQIEGAIIQPFINRPYLDATRKIHNRINKFCNEHSGHFYGMASINPHFKHEEYAEEAARCIQDLNFVGLKITTIAHAVDPGSVDGYHVFEVAQNLEVPVMVHTGAGIPFADPAALREVVAEFDDIKIILAHSGSDLFFKQALQLAKEFAHVYLEPSWLSIINIRTIFQEIGCSKVMFSSDHAVNVPVELTKYRTLLEDKQKLNRVLAGTAAEVFNLAIS